MGFDGSHNGGGSARRWVDSAPLQIWFDTIDKRMRNTGAYNHGKIRILCQSLRSVVEILGSTDTHVEAIITREQKLPGMFSALGPEREDSDLVVGPQCSEWVINLLL